MRRSMIVVLAFIACLFASQAMARGESRPYFTLSGGATLLPETGISDGGTDKRINPSIGFNGMIAGGLEWDVARWEASLGYNYQDLNEQNVSGLIYSLDGDLSMIHLLSSVFWDFNKKGMVSPYFGGGIGMARLNLQSSDLLGNDALSFAYQAGVGLTLNTSDDFVIDVGYRLLGTNSLDFGNTKADYMMFHNANIGLRWLF